MHAHDSLLNKQRKSIRNKRSIVNADQKLIAFVELQRAIHEFRGRFDIEKLTLFV